MEEVVIKNMFKKFKEFFMGMKIIFFDFRDFKLSYALRDVIYRVLTREKKKRYGNLNPDKVFYVIRSIDDKSPFYIGPIHNLLANYFYVISHLFYAESKGYIPIVDQKNYPVYNKLDEPINGTDNAWEYFWKQPCAFTLDEVYQSKNVILSKQSWKEKWNLGYDINKHKNEYIIDELYKQMEKIPYNDYTFNYIEEMVRQVFSGTKEVLGVSYRYGIYSENAKFPSKGHPKQTDVEALVELVKRFISKHNVEQIFLASNEDIAINMFKENFGEDLLYIQRNRRNAVLNEGMRENELFMYYHDQIYKTSLDYLTEMEMLSRCTYLLGTITSGLRYAIVKNHNNFKEVLLLDNGIVYDNRLRTDEKSY